MKDVSDSTKTQCSNLLLADLTSYNNFIRSHHKHADAAWASSDNGASRLPRFTQDIKFVDSDMRARRVWRWKHDSPDHCSITGDAAQIFAGPLRRMRSAIRHWGWNDSTFSLSKQRLGLQESETVRRSMQQRVQRKKLDCCFFFLVVGNHNQHQITPYHSSVRNMLKLAWLSQRQASLPSPYVVTSHSLSTA